MILRRHGSPLVLVSIAALLLAGCSSTRMGQGNALAEPEQLQPVQNSTVTSSALPTIGGNGSVQTMNGGNAGSVTTYPNQPNGPMVPDPALTGQPGANRGVSNPVQTANGDSSFVTLDAVGAVPNTPGRDLTGGLSVGKLLGGWTVVSGATQCRLNLTQTTKEGTQRYRASTPGCQLQQLAAVSSWTLAGSQVQLFDERGTMVAALILSGNRFIGTLSGGQGISMVG